jgi:AcrR family transcriptional regulator
MNREKLNTNSWIMAAFRALTIGGPQAIKVESIARDLKVSKGSFYWHFENVGALKTQMLQHWKSAASESVIANLEDDDTSAPDKLRLLIKFATGDANASYGGLLVESAIRDWARFDASATEAVRTVDMKRLNYLGDLFEQCISNPTMSKTNAAILYSALIGMEPLSHAGLVDLRNDLNCLLDKLLSTTR